MAKKERRQTRPEQIEEADKIYEWLIFQRGLAGELIRASVKLIANKEEAAEARVDLYMLVRNLAAAAAGNWNAQWRRYERHFIGDQNKRAFFINLRAVTRRIASTALITAWETGRERNLNADIQWDESLLPKSVAPWIVRLATLHPGVLEHFLPRFFMHVSDCLLHRSTYRRALLILEAVPEFGWSSETHARRLVELGEIQPSDHGSEAETVKKFIRDLRRRHKKRFALAATPTQN